jgi:hypothetical protein
LELYVVSVSLLEVAVTPESLHKPVCNQMRSFVHRAQKTERKKDLFTGETKEANYNYK